MKPSNNATWVKIDVSYFDCWKILAHGDINLYFHEIHDFKYATSFRRTKASLSLYINPPLLSLSWYGSKSSVKCFVVILLLSLLWTIRHKSAPSLQHSKQKRPRMTTKEKVICEMSWLCGLCNVKQFAWLLPIDSALQLKPQCAARWTAQCRAAGRTEE